MDDGFQEPLIFLDEGYKCVIISALNARQQYFIREVYKGFCLYSYNKTLKKTEKVTGMHKMHFFLQKLWEFPILLQKKCPKQSELETPPTSIAVDSMGGLVFIGKEMSQWYSM